MRSSIRIEVAVVYAILVHWTVVLWNKQRVSEVWIAHRLKHELVPQLAETVLL